MFGDGLGVLLVSDNTYESSVVLVSDTLSIGRANVLTGPSGSRTYSCVASDVAMCLDRTVARV